MATTLKQVATALLVAACLCGAASAAGTSRRKQLIYNGDEVSAASYPFGAIICSTMHSQEKCDAICTGSLVSPGVILTAAHCFNDFMDLYELDNDFEGRESYEREITSSYRVVFGVDKSGPHSVSDTVGVKKIVVGEPFEFGHLSSSWDVALIFLDECNTDTEPIKMLQIGSSDDGSEAAALESAAATATAMAAREVLPSQVSILGWGDSEGFCVTPYYSPDSHDPLQLMEYNSEACGSLAYCKQFPDRCDEQLTMCMAQENIASCNGDSGGPIFAQARVLPPASEQYRKSAKDESADGEKEEEEEGPGTEMGVGAVLRSDEVEEGTNQIKSKWGQVVEGGERKMEKKKAVASNGQQFVQVGVLSSGEVISTGASSYQWSARAVAQGPSRTFKDQATGAFLPAYNQWLKKHLAADACLHKTFLTVEDLFVDHTALTTAKGGTSD